jgi:hypothetical protein
MNSNINFWYEYTFNQGRQVQEIEHTGEKIDGRAIWKNIEVQVSEVDISGLKYNDSLEDIYKEMDKLIEKYNMEKSEFDPKYNHFFMQLKNLVKAKSNFEIKLNRVLQIAYNAGQLSIFLEKNELPEDVKDFIVKNNLISINTYISKENQTIIDEKYLNGTPLDKIRQNIHLLGGSSSYYKYKKYKMKYMNLKLKIENKLN